MTAVDVLNKQQQYNMMAMHLKGMKKQAASIATHGLPSCHYLGVDGSRCAIGTLIPDGHPAGAFEGDVERLLTEFPALTCRIDYSLGADFQNVHDEPKHWDENGLIDLQGRVQDIAKKHKLKPLMFGANR